MLKKFALALLMVLAAGPAIGQPAGVGGLDLPEAFSFDAGGNFAPDRTLPLPHDTYTDLFAVGSDPDNPLIGVRGLPDLPDLIRTDIGVIFGPGNDAGDRTDAARRLEEMAPQYPWLGRVLGAAADIERFEASKTATQFLVQAARLGDVEAPNALNQRYFYSKSGLRSDALSRSSLESLFTRGMAPGAESTLAQYFQFGVDGTADPGKARSYWLKAIENSNGNPANVLGYARFLRAQGNTEEAAQVLASVPGYPPAVAEGMNLAQEDPRGFTDEQRAQGDALAEAGYAPAALEKAKQFHSGSDASSWLRAEYFYLKAINGIIDKQEMPRAMARSGLGWLYLEHDGIAPTFTRDAAIARFEEAADFGDPGGLLGLASVALENGQLRAAFTLASRAADLGDDEQIIKANTIRSQVCQPGTNIACDPVPVFFATTRRPNSQWNGRTGFDNVSDDPIQVSLGIAFVRVPVTTGDSARGIALHDAVEAVAPGLFPNLDVPATLGLGDDIAILNGAERDALVSAAQAVAAGGDFGSRAFVYVHGFNNNFEAALRAAAEASEHSGFPAVPLLLSWSSRGTPFQYTADVAAAESGCVPLFPVFKRIGEVFGGSNMTVLAHSMGSQVVYDMIGGCGGDNTLFWDLPKIGNLIYAAPDMTRGDFIASFHHQRERAENVTLYATENDAALLLSQSVAFNDVKRAGLGGTGKRVLISPGLSTIDATSVESGLFDQGDITNHGYVFSRPEVIADLRLLMAGQTTIDATSRPCLEAGSGEASPYWSIKKDCLGP